MYRNMSKYNIYHIISLCFAILFLLSSCQQEKNTYTIKGKLENVKGDVFFAARENNDSLAVDTISINEKGEFSFTGHIDTLTVISLYFKEASGSPYILVDKGWNVEVTGDVNKPDLILAKGGEINNDLTKFKTDNIDLLKSRTEIVGGNNKNTAETTDSIVNKESVVELKNLNFELLNVASEYVKKNPTKIASVMLINNFFKNEDSLERLTEALDQLKGVAYDFPTAAQLREYQSKLKKSAVNSFAPIFKLKDLNGKEKFLTDFRGGYVLLIFESTICESCNKLRPQILKEYDILKKEKINIEFVSIVKDVEEEAISKELEKEIKWTILPEYGGWASQIFENYNIKGIPYGILISPEGKILERDVAFFNLKNQLEGRPKIKDIKKK